MTHAIGVVVSFLALFVAAVFGALAYDKTGNGSTTGIVLGVAILLWLFGVAVLSV
jgi:hypothetical protein